MSTLKINYDSIDAVSKNIASSGENFLEELKRIKDSNAKLQEAWAGTDEEAYATRVAEQAVEMQKLAEVINDISVYLQNVGEAYKNAQDRIKNSLMN